METRPASKGIIRKRVFYQRIPDDQKYTWRITPDLRTLFGFQSMITFLRRWSTASSGGLTFGGKQQCSCSSNGFSLVEIEVLYDGMSIRMLISRASLYILAFYCFDAWWSLKDHEIVIDGFPELETTSSYTEGPCRILGPNEVITAFMNIQTAENPLAASKFLPVFMHHISEAARFLNVETEIQRTLLPDTSSKHYHRDLLTCSYPISINLTTSVRAPQSMGFLVKKWGYLSKVWVFYILTNKRYCNIREDVYRDCKFRNRALELDSTLAILSSFNIDNLLEYYKGVLGKKNVVNDFPWITIPIIRCMELNLAEIRALNDGRSIYFRIADEHGEIDEGIGELCTTFKGSEVEELTKKLEGELGIAGLTVCTRSPGTLYPLALQLPPNNTVMHVVVVPPPSEANQETENAEAEDAENAETENAETLS